MESTALPRVPSLTMRLQLGLIGLLLVGAAIAWGVTGDRMQGMDAGPGTDLGTAGWFVGVWVVMMAAMMFPAIAPMVIMYARVQSGKRERGADAPAGATALFVAGYLVAWTTVGVLAYAIFDAVRALDIGFLAWDEGGRYIAGGVILGAAVYQLTPFKDVCLRKCRNPFMFVLNSWRPGRAGALAMGIEHGAWCVGCCWALMAALFALGVMSIGWMALIAAFIALEKLLPWKAVANRTIAVVLALLAIGVAVAPEDVPGLTLPDSPDAARAMEAMGTEGAAMEDEMNSGGMEGEAAGGTMDESAGGAMEGEAAGGAVDDGMSGP